MTVFQREQARDSGRLAVLGHQVLGSVSVVEGALETLQQNGGTVSASDRVLLEDQIEQNLAKIAEAARWLIRGDLE